MYLYVSLLFDKNSFSILLTFCRLCDYEDIIVELTKSFKNRKYTLSSGPETEIRVNGKNLDLNFYTIIT